ncbi:hypothetical protein CAP36_15820 [Chitinophagaceae bacterium IBVUCB2]|nr:hypothetical protein CAP36_15820 [Chitinophagaceae bacterium IBVUCB2]
MKDSFLIHFDFPLANSEEVIQLEAKAQLHHSSPYYVIDSVHFANHKQYKSSISLLPPIEIEKIQQDGKSSWVHKDSHRFSLLSLAIGKAIDEYEENNL